MKWIVVNADDLGASRGVNRGIAEAHRMGAVTSASLIVNMPASRDAARVTRDLRALSVGLHANMTDVSGRLLVDLEVGQQCGAVLEQQLHLFERLMGRPPTHVDSHRNLHRDPRLLPYFLQLADQCKVPLREHSPVRYFSKFYGHWSGTTHPEQIGVQSFIRLVETEIWDGVTELSCHPGYCDPDLRSTYRTEREIELKTLCDPEVQRFLLSPQIQPLNFVEAMQLVAGVARDQRTP